MNSPETLFENSQLFNFCAHAQNKKKTCEFLFVFVFFCSFSVSFRVSTLVFFTNAVVCRAKGKQLWLFVLLLVVGIVCFQQQKKKHILFGQQKKKKVSYLFQISMWASASTIKRKTWNKIFRSVTLVELLSVQSELSGWVFEALSCEKGNEMVWAWE